MQLHEHLPVFCCCCCCCCAPAVPTTTRLTLVPSLMALCWHTSAATQEVRLFVYRSECEQVVRLHAQHSRVGFEE